MPLIDECESAKDAWDALKTQFEGNTIQNIIYLKRQYQGLKFDESIGMLALINSHKQMAVQLASVGAPVTEMEQIWHLLLRLPDLYGWLVNGIDPNVELKLQDIRQRLLFEEQKR